MNTDNLRTFLQGDGIWILTAIAVLLAIKAWRNSCWLLRRHCLNRKRTRHPKSGRLVPTTLWY